MKNAIFGTLFALIIAGPLTAVEFIRQGSNPNVVVGPFLDPNDGVTPVTGLSFADGDYKILKDGATSFVNSRMNEAFFSHLEDGYYLAGLDPNDCDELGNLTTKFSDPNQHTPVWTQYVVLPANVYDSLFSTDKLEVDVMLYRGSTAAESPATPGKPAVALVEDNTIYVDPNDVATIEATIEGATAGTVIKFAPGFYEYTGGIIDLADDITLEGAGAHATYFKSSVILSPTFRPKDRCVLKGMTVDAVSVWGQWGGAQDPNQSSLDNRIENCVIGSVLSTDGIRYAGTADHSLTISNCTVRNGYDFMVVGSNSPGTFELTMENTNVYITEDNVNDSTIGFALLGSSAKTLNLYNVHVLQEGGDNGSRVFATVINSKVRAANCSFHIYDLDPNAAEDSWIIEDADANSSFEFVNCEFNRANTSGGVEDSNDIVSDVQKTADVEVKVDAVKTSTDRELDPNSSGSLAKLADDNLDVAVSTATGSWPVSQTPVSKARTWKIKPTSSGLKGDAIRMQVGEAKLFALDFSSDIPVNHRVTSITAQAISTGTAGGVTFDEDSDGVDGTLAKIHLTAVTAGEYELKITVVYSDGSTAVAIVDLTVVE